MAEQCANPLDHPLYKSVQIVRLYSTAVFAMLVWDWAITIRKEYDWLWRASWTPIKGCFLFLRYYTLLVFPIPLALWTGNFSFEDCQKMHRLEPGLCMPIIWAAECILLLRAYAIWDKNKLVLALGALLLCAVIGFQLLCTLTVVALPPPPGTNKFACVAAGRPGSAGSREAVGYWVAPFVFDFAMTALTLFRSISYKRKGASSGVLQTFISQGLAYFVLIAACNLVNTVFFLQPDQALQPVNAMATVLFTSLFAQRLVLQLRSAGLAGTSHHSHSASHAFSDAAFPHTSSKATSKEMHGAHHGVGLTTIGGSARPVPKALQPYMHDDVNAPPSRAGSGVEVHLPPGSAMSSDFAHHAYGRSPLASRATTPRKATYAEATPPTTGVSVNFSREVHRDEDDSDVDHMPYSSSFRDRSSSLGRDHSSPLGRDFVLAPDKRYQDDFV